MNEKQIRQRIKQMHMAEIAAGELGLWWLSFADDTGFRGVVIVEAYGFTDALAISRDKGLNPGGEVQGWRVDPTDHPEGMRNRLLKKPDLAGFAVSTKDMDKKPIR